MTKDWRFWAGIGIAALLMWLSFRDMDFALLRVHVVESRWWWFIPGAFLWFTNWILKVHRWKWLLPGEDPPFRRRWNAFAIGFFFTMVLPLRIGEFVRAWVLGKSTGRSASGVFASVVVERIFDMFAVLVLLTIAIPFVPMGEGEGDFRLLLTGGAFLLTATVAVSVILLYKFGERFIDFSERLMTPVPAAIREKILKMGREFVRGIGGVENKTNLLKVILVSFVVWIFNALFFYFGLHAFPYAGSWPSPTAATEVGAMGTLFMQGIICFAIAVPAPGFVGTFHAAIIYALSLYGMDRASAQGFALVSHFISFSLVILVGLEGFRSEGLAFGEVKRGSESREGGGGGLGEDRA